MKYLWPSVFLVLVLAGCNYSKVKTAAEDFPSPANYKASELSFGSVYSRVFRPNCISCHGNSGDVNLESYASAKSALAKIYQSAIVERKMPKAPGARLSSGQLGLLNAWIKAGAPETFQGEEPLPPLEPKFASIKMHILEPKCVMCHAPGQAVARIPLVTKEDLLNSPLDIVIPGNPDESGIILSVTSPQQNKIMPPLIDANGKPTGFTHLTDEQIKAIRDWIQNGAND